MPESEGVALAATAIGVAGVPLATLAWRRFRGSPFGRAMATLPPFLALSALSYVTLGGVTRSLRTLALALLAAFAALLVRTHGELSRREEL